MKNSLKSIALFMGMSLFFVTASQAQETVTIQLKGSGGYKSINGDRALVKYEAEVGSLVTLEAYESEYGYAFAFFTLNNTYKQGGTVVSNENPYKFVAEKDMTFYVNFLDFGNNPLLESDLTTTVDVIATEGGNAYIQNHVTNQILLGEKITILAAANEGYNFIGWTDSNNEVLTTLPTLETVVSGPIKYTAVFESTQTCIKEVVAEREALVYDLGGRRVENITKPGTYIVNGKKTVVR